MRTATTTRIKSESLNITVKNPAAYSEKHSLFYNLGILLEVSKNEKMENSPETAAAIIREYEFLSLVNGSKFAKLH